MYIIIAGCLVGGSVLCGLEMCCKVAQSWFTIMDATLNCNHLYIWFHYPLTIFIIDVDLVLVQILTGI